MVVASVEAVEKVRFLKGDSAFHGLEEKLRAALARNRAALYEPPNSAARLVRRSILSCSPVIRSCQFTFFLPSDTQLPAPEQQIPERE